MEENGKGTGKSEGTKLKGGMNQWHGVQQWVIVQGVSEKRHPGKTSMGVNNQKWQNIGGQGQWGESKTTGRNGKEGCNQCHGSLNQELSQNNHLVSGREESESGQSPMQRRAGVGRWKWQNQEI